MDTFLLPQRLEVNNLFSLYSSLKQLEYAKFATSIMEIIPKLYFMEVLNYDEEVS
nr:MAG TPA: hypothetical protein [Caudoviricetes sp.]